MASHIVARETLGNKPNEKISDSLVFPTPTPEDLLAKKNELATTAEDLVGDLLKEIQEDTAKADGRAPNHAASDLPSGWETVESNLASSGNQEKSGATTPDHKKRADRSSVGRQGMASLTAK